MNDAILTELQAMHGTLRRIAEALEGKPASQTPGTPSQTRPATPEATRTALTGSKPPLKIGAGLKPRIGTTSSMNPMPTAPQAAPRLDGPRPVARNAPRLDVDDDIPF